MASGYCVQMNRLLIVLCAWRAETSSEETQAGVVNGRGQWCGVQKARLATARRHATTCDDISL